MFKEDTRQTPESGGSGSLKDVDGKTQFDLEPFRGLVCLWIVAVHIWPPAVEAIARAIGFPLLVDIAANLRLGVECFFMLSGMMLAHGLRITGKTTFSAKLFLFRRLIRLLIPYQAALLICFLNFNIGSWLYHSTGTPQKFWDWLTTAVGFGDALADKPLGGLIWSMQPLIQFTLACTLAFWVSRRIAIGKNPNTFANTTNSVLKKITLLVFVGSLTTFLLFRGVLYTSEIWALPRVSWMFCLGFMIYWVSTGKLSRKWLAAALFAVVSGTVLTSVITENIYHMVWGLKVAVGTVILLLIGKGYKFPISRITQIFAAIGTRSYAIYLTHMMVSWRFSWLMRYWFPDTDFFAVVLFPLNLLACVAAGFVFHRFIVVPATNLAKQIQPRGNASRKEPLTSIFANSKLQTI